MPRRNSRLIAWGGALLVFTGAVVMIHLSKRSYVAKATAEISRLAVAPGGLASFARVEFARGERMMPQEIVARLRSSGTIRRALEVLKWPADDSALEDVSSRVTARLLPGTTIIEVIGSDQDPRRAEALVNAVLSVQDDIRRDERVTLASQILAMLEEAGEQLKKESSDVASKLAKLDVYRPVEFANYSDHIEGALIEVQSQRVKMAEALRRLEQMGSTRDETLLEQIEDLRKQDVEDDVFASKLGYVDLRTSLTNKKSELARAETTQGANSSKVAQLRSELGALAVSLRHYLEGVVVQLRSQVTALDQSAADILQRVHKRNDALITLRDTKLSPAYEALSLRSEVIRSQLKEIERRRAEMLAFRQMHEPVVAVISAAQAADSPVDKYRGARLVFAGFGSFFIGVSLNMILGRRSTCQCLLEEKSAASNSTTIPI